MEERERGFIVIHRKVRSSALYRSLDDRQRSVFYTLLLLANWAAARIIHAGRWHLVDRGEFFHSLEVIADEAASSIKVVRTTLAKVMADDSGTGGRGPFLKERWTGTVTGRGLRILTVVNYDEYQRVDDAEGTPRGTTRARQGHDKGTAGAPREPSKPEEPLQPELILPAEKAPVGRHQPTIDLFMRLWSELRGGEYRIVGGRDGSAVKQLLRYPEATDAEVERRMRLAFADDWFRSAGNLALFVSRWPNYDGKAHVNGVSKPPVTAAAEPAAAFKGGRSGF